MSILETPRQAVWTGQSASTAVFIPLTGALAAMEWATVVASYELDQSLGNLKVMLAHQVSQDGVTWTDGDALLSTTYSSTLGWTYGTEAIALQATGKLTGLFVRFGLKVINTTGTSNLSYARARLRIQGRAS